MKSIPKAAESNQQAAEILMHPELFAELLAQLYSENSIEIIAAANTLGRISLKDPQMMVTAGPRLVQLLKHPLKRVRWQSMEAYSPLAALLPELTQGILDELEHYALNDSSTIIRDHAIQSLAYYAGSSVEAAAEVHPLLIRILDQWQDRHAARIFSGLHHIARLIPQRLPEILLQTEAYLESPRPTVIREAKRIRKLG